MSLYTRLKELGVEIGNWQSDLQFPKNDITTKLILEEFPGEKVRSFHSQVDGTQWYEVPFAYDPFWEGKMNNDKNNKA